MLVGRRWEKKVDMLLRGKYVYNITYGAIVILVTVVIAMLGLFKVWNGFMFYDYRTHKKIGRKY
jgi:hypothetical protein